MINKVILVGNVGADPEVRTIDSGVKVAKIRIATTERVPNKDKSGYTDVTEWHNVTLWRNLAEVVDRYVRKGSQLYIEGKLRTREYDKNGTKCYTTEIVAEELKMLGKREASSTPAPSPAVAVTYNESPSHVPMPSADPDDLPF